MKYRVHLVSSVSGDTILTKPLPRERAIKRARDFSEKQPSSNTVVVREPSGDFIFAFIGKLASR